ncbi:hypothetical protein FRC04_004267 [Tulasnella sp. 424]|nr:hypothetical protein FRC04_004267 [Tulasnella sp. 424]KAG8979391.1 hypothetical protein FRC05_008376 [Tulasnella sp. 425]
MAQPAAMKEQQTIWVDGEERAVPDLSHHLSHLANNRKPSPLKQLAKYMMKPGILSLAGGMPHPEYFPYDSLSAKVLAHDSYDTKYADSNPDSSSHADGPLDWFWSLIGLGGSSKKRTEDITIPKYRPQFTDNQLAIALQYGTAQGIIPLQKFVGEFTHKVFKPYLPTTSTTITTGNTDAWNRVVEAFCNKGDGLLVEEWSYPSALFTSRPHGVVPVPVAMDLEGMRSDALETVLRTWDEGARGIRRPHIMYLVPIGQNPSGATMSTQRKKEIYDIAVKYDIIIVEDDPYYFLQEGPYQPQSYRQRRTNAEDPETWLSTLSPSFLKFDWQGRVIRLDSFSKTVAPGSRMGWVSANPLFADAILRVGEVSTQAPCGFGQSMITELLVNHWGFDKYVRWLQGLQKQYTDRRDLLIDAIASEFDLVEAASAPDFFGGARVLCAREKRSTWNKFGYADEKEKDTWFSFIPPTSGMFVWVRIHLVNHPSYGAIISPEEPVTLEEKLFYTIAEKNLLIGPGWFFTTKVEDEMPLDETDFPGDAIVNGLMRPRARIDDPTGDPADHNPAQYAHFRVAFSSASESEMKEGMKIFASVLRDFFSA